MPAMRVAVFTSVSETPEHDAFKALAEWAGARGYGDLDEHPVYGFERPDLYRGQERAYTFWVRVPEDSEQERAPEIIDVPAATYATTVCATHGDPLGAIPRAWQRLDEWVKANGRRMKADAPCLERHLTGNQGDDFVLELHYPLEG